MSQGLERFKYLFFRTPEEQTAQAKVVELETRFAKQGRLKGRDQDELTWGRFLSRRATRRVLLARGLAFGGLGAIAGGAAVLGIRLKEDDPNLLEEQQENDAKPELLQAIEDLPPSVIKDLLDERVIPYFRRQTPFIAERGDFKYPVHAAFVNREFTSDPDSLDSVWGRYKGVVFPDYSPVAVSIAEKKRLLIPLVAGLVRQHEKNIIPPENLAEDGTAVFIIEAATGDKIVEGMIPEITVLRPRSKLLNETQEDTIKALEKAVLIKEAATCLLEDIMVEQTYLKMKELGLPTHVLVRKRSGDTEMAEIIHSAVYVISNLEGRWRAAIDLAGAFVSLKAIEKSPLLRYLREDPTFELISDSLAEFDLGNNAAIILSRAIDRAISFPDIGKLPIKGDINKIP